MERRARLPFQGWILAGCLLVVTVTLLFVYLLMDRSLKEQLFEQERATLGKALELAVDIVGARYAPGVSLDESQNLAKHLGRLLDMRVTLIDPKGKVKGDSSVARDKVPEMENHAGRPELLKAMEAGYGFSRRYSDTLKKELLYIARRLPDKRGAAYIFVRVATPLSQLEEAEEKSRRLYLGVMALGILLSLGVAFLVARTISGPVEDLTETARAISAGDLDRRFLRYPSHEIGDLGRVFDHMADSLQAELNAMKREKQRVEAILRSMVEGVLVVDRAGRVVMANRAFSRLLRPEAASCKPSRQVTECVRNLEVLEAIQAVRRGAVRVQKDLTLFGDTPRHLQLHVTSLNDDDGNSGAVAVVHDVTAFKEAEIIRREFVSNVSHELRTPLTAIMGSAETLLDGALDQKDYARHFVEMIERQGKRLLKLVNDLLDLGRLENEEFKPNLELLEAAEVLDAVISVVDKAAEEKGVEVARRLPPHPVPLRADRQLLEQALINLMDNAIKYNREGGKATLAVEHREGEVIFSVEDNGLGIEPADQARLFERFYRVDKARSRDMGGTGLGLAIVKHTVAAHGGEVKVVSAPGKGSTFQLIFPAVG